MSTIRRLVVGMLFVAVAVMIPASVASAASYVGVPPPRVGPVDSGANGGSGGSPAFSTTELGPGVPVATGRSGDTPASSGLGGLALTGGDLAELALLGGVCAGMGVSLRRRARRRSTG